jgi:predicted adenine nucleotide alpha hydrolase (AANH) superfamily ATPase
MHICCGPCAVYPTNYFKSEGIEFTGYFCNPNIHPEDEYIRRLENAKKLAKIKRFPIIINDLYMENEWPIGEDTCEFCYRTRFAEVFSYALENGFDTVTTTLLVSPYQKHDLIVEIFEELTGKTGIKFLYKDFREGYRAGQNEARDLGLYRQKYCGCINSRGKS